MANLTGNFRKKSMGDFDKGSENFERIPQGLVVFFYQAGVNLQRINPKAIMEESPRQVGSVGFVGGDI